jgi:molybdopterin molybdotransferase
MNTSTRAPVAGLLLLEDALERILEGVWPLAAESVGLDEALGSVLAAPLPSRLTLPPWDNSAMDGFAVRAADVADAQPEAPVVLRVAGEVAAGHLPAYEVVGGTCVRILTGAPMPTGADAVVPVEDTDAPTGTSEAPPSVSIGRPAPVGAHVRRAGSDVVAGDRLLARGAILNPATLAVAAAGGHGSVVVYRRPRVAVVATGDELVPAGKEPGPAQIPDSNSVGLVAQAREAGAEARHFGIARDSLGHVTEVLEAAIAWADAVVVSGGVSVGAHDVVKEAFSRLGRMELWRVAVQPGKPLAFGRVDGGAGGSRVLLFGLPGNPVSSFVTFELFVRPALRRMAGRVDLSGREWVRATLAEPVTKSPGRRAFLRVCLERRDGVDPPWRARLAGGQGSHVLSALAAADGLAVVGEADDTLPEGATVDVIRLTGMA